MIRSDICIAGAGIIGLSLALELHARGLAVVVVESSGPMQQSSTAAAGMLAADDPHNPAEISDLSHLSLSLYAGYLDRVRALTGVEVPFQTCRTLQALRANTAPCLIPELQAELLRDTGENSLSEASGFTFLHEHSIDPRQLAAALIAAVAATSVRTLYDSRLIETSETATAVVIKTATEEIHAGQFVDCSGAWAGTCKAGCELDTFPAFPVIPIKGQMLALAMPEDRRLRTVLRTEDIYVVPRTVGPNAGRAIVGATVEDVGFDKTVEPPTVERLRQRATTLIPGLARAAIVHSWAGLRPATGDRLPLIGRHPTRPHHWLATGHYRNGILLAPATAHVMAQLLLKEVPLVAVDAFSPGRLATAELSARA